MHRRLCSLVCSSGSLPARSRASRVSAERSKRVIIAPCSTSLRSPLRTPQMLRSAMRQRGISWGSPNFLPVNQGSRSTPPSF